MTFGGKWQGSDSTMLRYDVPVDDPLRYGPSGRPTVASVWIPQLPKRLWWDHNAHYHRWVLRQLPPRPERVLDVGCGAGRLACTLAGRAAHVDGLDRSPVMIDGARRRCPQAANVRWLEGEVLDPGLALRDDGYDAIIAVSSLHHMPLDDALERLVGLLRPGGVLVVVGHYRPATSGDRVLGLIALPANWVAGAALALRGLSGKPDDEGMPVLPSFTTLAELRAAIAPRLPGARLHRTLFWRYLLTWHRSACMIGTNQGAGPAAGPAEAPVPGPS